MAKYTADGSVWTYDDGKGNLTVITKDKDDKYLTLTSGGWTFATFDSESRPLTGSKPGEGGKTETVTVEYADDGSSVWTYIDADGAKSLVYRNSEDKVVKMVQDGWTYTEFDVEGRPLFGTKGEDTVRINYGTQGITESTFTTPDGHTTIIGVDQNNRPIFEIVDGIPAAYAVEIPKLGNAISTVRKEKASIESFLSRIGTSLADTEAAWVSPAGRQFAAKAGDVKRVAGQLTGVLEDSITAMEKSYQHYLDAEGGNLANLTPATNSPTFNAWNAAWVAHMVQEAIKNKDSESSPN